MIDAKIFQLLGRIFTFMSKNLFCFCVILGASYFLYRLASNGFLYGADTSNKVAGIFTPLIVGGVTAYVAWNQYKLAQRQHELAREQKTLAAQQAQTAVNKLRLDLFDKRYELYQMVLNVFEKFSVTNANVESLILEDIHGKPLPYMADIFLERKKQIEVMKLEMFDDLRTLRQEMHKISFLFNESSRNSLYKMIMIMYDYLREIQAKNNDVYKIIENDCYLYYFIDSKMEYNGLLLIMRPYMDLSEIL